MSGLHTVTEGGMLIEQWDDETRTHTDYRATPPATRPYDADENAAADARADAAARLDDLTARVTALEALVLTLAPTPDPETGDVPDWHDPTGAHDAYPPGALVRWDGLVWKNVAGTWLVHSPAAYPRGWEHVPTSHDPEPTTEWAPGIAYAVGDLVTYDGATYRCMQAHTSQTGWQPPAVAALWALI